MKWSKSILVLMLMADGLIASTYNIKAYNTMLHNFVSSEGFVSYYQLIKNPKHLNLYLDSVSKLSNKEYKKWSRNKKFSFWINVYNAFTLKTILDYYPIKSSFFKSLFFEKNSIIQIDDPFKKKRYKVMGKLTSLDQVENSILRPRFKDARLHAAIVCASYDCPPLRNEAFSAQKLDVQLDEQVRKFLRKKNSLQCENSEVSLSKIFKWFNNDFVSYVRLKKKNTTLAKKQALMLFLKYYGPNKYKECLSQNDLDISYNSYNWSLNGR